VGKQTPLLLKISVTHAILRKIPLSALNTNPKLGYVPTASAINSPKNGYKPKAQTASNS
jgi:hypothetical protein